MDYFVIINLQLNIFFRLKKHESIKMCFLLKVILGSCPGALITRILVSSGSNL